MEKNTRLDKYLMGDLFMKFIDKPEGKNELYEIDRYPNIFTNFWFDFNQLYKSHDRLKHLTDRLYANLDDDGKLADILLYRKENKLLGLSLKKKFNSNKKNIVKTAYNEGSNTDLNNKKVCFVDDIVLSKSYIKNIKRDIKSKGGELVGYITVFNNIKEYLKKSIITSLFLRKNMDDHDLKTKVITSNNKKEKSNILNIKDIIYSTIVPVN